jgi:hypothetical protein
MMEEVINLCWLMLIDSPSNLKILSNVFFKQRKFWFFIHIEINIAKFYNSLKLRLAIEAD